MARRDFVSIPAVPDDIKQQFPGLAAHLSVLGENIELLAGLRGASDNHAVLKGMSRSRIRHLLLQQHLAYNP